MEQTNVTTFQCSKCKQEQVVKADKRGTFRLPRNGGQWKRIDDHLWCGKCVKGAYCTLCVRLPIYKPIDVDWKRFDELMSECWNHSTSLANWAIHTLAKNDIVRTADMTKCPKQPEVYLYGEWRKHYTPIGFWEGSTAAVISILKNAQKLYSNHRRDVIWRRREKLQLCRYPYPFYLDRDGWSARMDGDKPILSLALPGGRVELEMKNKADLYRQLERFRQIADGLAMAGELSIYKKGKHTLVSIAARFPRKAGNRNATETLLVTTDPNAFWVCQVNGRQPWLVNADHIRRRVTAHKTYLQRISEDTKHEKRWPKRMRQQINVSRDKRCQKHGNRINAWCHEATAMLIKFAERNHVAEIIYDDTCQDYLESFPWFNLKEKLKNKCEQIGVVFTHVQSQSKGE